MTTNSETIILNGSREAVEAINEKIKELVGSQTKVTERRNLDGDTATWIVVATLASQALPSILNFIKEFIGGKNVTKIVWNGFQVENPTKEMVDDFAKKLKADLNQSNPNG